MARKKATPSRIRRLQKRIPTSVIGLIAIGVIIGLLTIIALTPRTHTSQTVTPIGKSMTSPTVALTINSVTEVAAREFFSRQVIDGEKGLIVRLSVTNLTNTTQSFIPTSQIFAKTSDGQLYQMKPLASVKDSIVAGDVAPGETLSGEISFMVKSDAQALQLHFDPRWDNSLPLVGQL